jgi:hypothetical protein
VTTALADKARAARNASSRARKRGQLAPLGINPETGRRFINTGRSPTSGTRTRLLDVNAPMPMVDLSGRFRSRRERASELKERMQGFSRIYNAGWMLRDSYFGPDARRREMVERFLAVMAEEARGTQDYEALLFAAADAVTCGSHGCPWET